MCNGLLHVRSSGGYRLCVALGKISHLLFGTSRPTEGFITPPSTDFRAQLRGGELSNEPAKEAEVLCAMVGNHGGTRMIAAF